MEQDFTGPGINATSGGGEESESGRETHSDRRIKTVKGRRKDYSNKII
jgi:hypothetical protein